MFFLMGVTLYKSRATQEETLLKNTTTSRIAYPTICHFRLKEVLGIKIELISAYNRELSWFYSGALASAFVVYLQWYHMALWFDLACRTIAS